MTQHKLDNSRESCTARSRQGLEITMTHSSNPPLAASLIRIEGTDATAFAQAQFSSDVGTLATGAWQWSAWLDAQGRVAALFELARTGERQLLMVLRGGDAEAVAAGLKRYVFRSRVDIAAHAPMPAGDAGGLPAFAVEGDAHEVKLGFDTYGLHVPASAQATQAWRLRAIRAGHPWLPGPLRGRFLAPALSLRRLGAVSLTKGCFPGQEIVARLHYRGGHKYALCHLRVQAPLAPGSTLHVPAGGHDEIVVLDCAASDTHGHEALAVLHESLIAELPRDRAVQANVPQLLQTFPA